MHKLNIQLIKQNLKTLDYDKHKLKKYYLEYYDYLEQKFISYLVYLPCELDINLFNHIEGLHLHTNKKNVYRKPNINNAYDKGRKITRQYNLFIMNVEDLESFKYWEKHFII